MNDNLRMFLAYSFAQEPLDSRGERDPSGISDKQLADHVAGWVAEFSHGRIEVVRTLDPHGDYISSQVRRDICSSDVMLCLFTKRTKDHLKGLWLPSTYVVSEASASLMQFPSERHTHRRLFGLVEEGVDPEQLGMAFHRNKTAETFSRDRLEDLRAKVAGIVSAIHQEKIRPRLCREYVALDKTVSIFRDGSVLIECRHRFRFTEPLTSVKFPHAMWRVGRELPNLDALLTGVPSQPPGFLRCLPVTCGRRDQNACRWQIKPAQTNSAKNERNFVVAFSSLNIEPGDELAYEIAWGYPKAFHDPTKLAAGIYNSVGVRTGERGMAHSVSLTLKFQRDLNDDPVALDRILEEHPRIFVVGAPLLPPDQETFWHSSSSWLENETLQPCPNRSGTLFEVYRWSAPCFQGMAKAIWTPHLNYFQEDEAADAEHATQAKLQ